MKMAFDRPLEADRVDDLGLLSTFVRAPVLGPIMWILGRKLGENDKDEDKENHLLRTPTDISKSTTASDHLDSSYGQFPDMSSSTISDIMNNLSISDEKENANSGNKGKAISTEESKINETQNSQLQRQKKTRKMSWSDESGQSLVEYYDLSQSSSHQGTPPSLYYPAHKKKPIKSAMKRSSGNQNVRNTQAPIHPSQCIPSGLAGGSIVMPTGGGLQQMQHQQHSHQQQNSNNANGYISPQYGWYISMTPPTPPHYHDSSVPSSSMAKKEGEVIQQQQLPPNGHTIQMNHHLGRKPFLTGGANQPHRPVFTRSLKGVPNNTSGWPSVPL